MMGEFHQLLFLLFYVLQVVGVSAVSIPFFKLHILLVLHILDFDK